MFETISPLRLGAQLPEKRNARVEELLGYSPEELELRCKTASISSLTPCSMKRRGRCATIAGPTSKPLGSWTAAIFSW